MVELTHINAASSSDILKQSSIISITLGQDLVLLLFPNRNDTNETGKMRNEVVFMASWFTSLAVLLILTSSSGGKFLKLNDAKCSIIITS